MKIGSVVQFNENHKWCGCIGMIEEIKKIETGIRFMVGIPVPDSGTIFTFVMDYENAFDYIGEAKLVYFSED